MEARHHQRQGALPVIAFALLLLSVVYVLAIGPAHWLMDHGYISEATFDALYWHFIVAVKRSPAVQQIVVWYIDLWVTS